ncbi:hypothetical protein FRB96_006613 [Tulasnella sp. 330]|nr:hypothetical protein FRB96_006613 [Tulasnella sp. 330]KAG8884659.1 hypothetical protein FRB97_003715 [Tulasnella sp. 331]KAG8889746.1 hypothetical protein FRB98_003038 [Tulasnella sp. 332]
MSDLSSFLSSSWPEYKSPPPPRLQSLYSDISRQKLSNPDGFRSSIGWWTKTLQAIVKAGKQPQSSDHLVLHATDQLSECLRWEKVGRPLGLGAILEDLTSSSAAIPLVQFLKSSTSIDYTPSLAYRAATYVLGKPLWWALSQLSLAGDDGLSITSEQRWKKFHGDYVIRSLVEEAGDAAIAHQAHKPTAVTEALYDVELFKSEFEEIVLPGETLSDLDIHVLLKYLERDRRVIVIKKGIIKFVAFDEVEEISEVDRGILEMKATLRRLDNQIDEIERQITERTAKIKDLLYQGSKTLAMSYLRSKKQLEELLVKRLGSQETLQTVLLRIESAVTDVEIMKAYDTSAKTLKKVLQHPLLQVSSIEDTMEQMSDALADHREIEDAIGLANEDAMAAAGVEPVDEKELQEELDALVQEQKAEDEKKRPKTEKDKTAEQARRQVEAESKGEERRKQQAKALAEEQQGQEVSTLASPNEPNPPTSAASLTSVTQGDVSPDSQSANWERHYETTRAEKAAQAIRDREAELRMRDRWDTQGREAVREA